eukprot:3806350-Pyramimonas_sp.AAC.1
MQHDARVWQHGQEPAGSAARPGTQQRGTTARSRDECADKAREARREGLAARPRTAGRESTPTKPRQLAT